MILIVVRQVVRHDRVRIIVATVQEHTHERLVIARIECRRLADRREVDRERTRGTHEAELHRALEHEASRPQIVVLRHAASYFWMRYWGELRISKHAPASRLSLLSCVLSSVTPTACSAASMRSTVAL